MPFKRTLIGLGCIILASMSLCEADDSTGPDSPAPSAIQDTTGMDSSKDAAIQSKVVSPEDLSNQTADDSKSDVNQVGIYSLGGKLLVDRATQLLSIKTSSATLTNTSIAALRVTTITYSDNTTQSTAPPSLHFLQAPVFASETTGGTTSGTGFNTIGAQVSITPTSASSTIYIFGAAAVANSLTGGTTVMGVNGTTSGDLVTTATTPYVYQQTDTNQRVSTLSGFFKDTPGTTTTQTYKLRFAANNNGTSTIGGAVNTGRSTYIIAFEVK